LDGEVGYRNDGNNGNKNHQSRNQQMKRIFFARVSTSLAEVA